MWDLVPWPDIRLQPFALGVQSLSQQEQEGSPYGYFLKKKSIGGDAGKLEPLYTAGGNAKWCSYCRKQFYESWKSLICYHVAAAESLSRVRLCETEVHCSAPGSSVCGILQARVLEWVAMPSSRRVTIWGRNLTPRYTPKKIENRYWNKYIVTLLI